MTSTNKNHVHVTEEFERATINMIKQVLRSNRVMRINNYEKNKVKLLLAIGGIL